MPQEEGRRWTHLVGPKTGHNGVEGKVWPPGARIVWWLAHTVTRELGVAAEVQRTWSWDRWAGLQLCHHAAPQVPAAGVPVLQMRRLREVQALPQGHTARAHGGARACLLKRSRQLGCVSGLGSRQLRMSGCALVSWVTGQVLTPARAPGPELALGGSVR